MKWKTDWAPSDDYGRNGAVDFNRLQNNLKDIADSLLSKYGVAVNLIDIPDKGYGDYPFADLLNATEENIQAVGVWPKLNEKPIMFPTGTFRCGSSVRIRRPMLGYARKNWFPASPAPTFDDVNRWEGAGEWAEKTTTKEPVNHVCGTIACGTSQYEPYITT